MFVIRAKEITLLDEIDSPALVSLVFGLQPMGQSDVVKRVSSRSGQKHKMCKTLEMPESKNTTVRGQIRVT